MGASAPIFGAFQERIQNMIIETCVNISDEILFGNVFANSHKNVPWIKSISEHDGHAVLVGGGPSVLEWVEEIRWRKSIGQKIFALNGAGRFLHQHGIEPDYQVILDARVQNSSFIGYAREYLLASQCHPSLFDLACKETSDGVYLWHQDYPDNMEQFDASLPVEHAAHTLIGGGTTVGLSALALVYAFGYRKLHLYGYDSSFRAGKGHAYAQVDNQEILCINTVEGREFQTTLSMAQQAERFPQVSDMLIEAGCIVTIHGDGLLPWISKMASRPDVPMTEQEKYQKMWAFDDYRKSSPGEDCADLFTKLAMPQSDDVIYDFGCGTGRAAMKLVDLCHVKMFDFVDNCLDPQVRKRLDERLSFKILDITEKNALYPLNKENFAYCTDVMEHIPPQYVDVALTGIIRSARKAFFQISLVKDNFGELIGHHLHLSVHPFTWWKDKLEAFGKIAYSEDNGHSAIFYLTT